jgi:hypothetical protein
VRAMVIAQPILIAQANNSTIKRNRLEFQSLIIHSIVLFRFNTIGIVHISDGYFNFGDF